MAVDDAAAVARVRVLDGLPRNKTVACFSAAAERALFERRRRAIEAQILARAVAALAQKARIARFGASVAPEAVSSDI